MFQSVSCLFQLAVFPRKAVARHPIWGGGGGGEQINNKKQVLEIKLMDLTENE